ncbi:hypothetical protein MLD38_019213 [Melastoma candidum]|uniref:Uncharacterized protein n=1 Tax=Melastoma candidum TaxID=119954 RepID=A0ACB9QVG2_9MYRT|nr:hypothetical protein MLD38_019213 [Melastoma candidum]
MMDCFHAAGDLTDVVRSGSSSGSNNVSLPSTLIADWSRGFASISGDNSIATLREGFGDPFSDTGDPLLRDGTELDAAALHDGNNSPAFGHQFVVVEEKGSKDGIGPPSSGGRMFSHMLACETSPLVEAEGPVPPPSLGRVKCSGDYNYTNNSQTLLGSTMTVDRGTAGMMQISSPRNPGMKRRRSQAKKVVCIPAPAAPNSRPSSGEVVPSDLWAWRKYGQKPIKGSPYPRGYYRCSSSKGCSARKQVERSRTDPSMLVITYTSEHNHPWPTQRNSLAGLTRSTSKGGSISKSSANSNTPHPTKPRAAKKEERTGNSSYGDMSSTVVVAGGLSGTATSVKEEMGEAKVKQFDMEDSELVADGPAHCYRPSMTDELDRHPDDFFADLGELDADPYNLLFDQGFTGNYRSQRGNKSLDAFNLLDWADEDDVMSFTEVTKKGL